MVTKPSNTELAKSLVDDFLLRTGISQNKGNKKRRYLWTDAFAVQTIFSLYHTYDGDYATQAIKLIDHVHEILAKFRIDDHRKGWISGLPEEEGKMHPTIRGLRIGKHMPERQPDEPFDRQLEWERDGQYFHYNSQWVYTLLQGYYETGEDKYLNWATDMIKACQKFIYCNAEPAGMYWKMSTDLTHPLVRSMGAHDPLEGLICCESIMAADESKNSEIADLKNCFEYLCQNKNWTTSDPLGVGILLVNTKRSSEVLEKIGEVPESMHPKKLLIECIYGLESFAGNFDNNESSSARLAFRECGLSYGLNVLWQDKNSIGKYVPEIESLDRYMHLADAIESFWSKPENRHVSTWTDHLDINAVMLAASLVASEVPEMQKG